MMNIGLLLSHDKGVYAVRPHRSIEIFRHCVAAVPIGIAAEVVYALNPRVSALFHYSFELPWSWLNALKFDE